MVFKGIDPEGLALYCLEYVYNESSRSVLTIGLPVRISDDDIGEVYGSKDAPEKILDKYL